MIGDYESQRGFGLLEVLVAAALTTVLVSIGLFSFFRAYERGLCRATAREAVQVIRHARAKALKEKVRHRVVFNDESAGAPNRILLQSEVAGSFVTIAGHTYPAPGGVAILGSGSTNSVDSVIIGTRGDCQPGLVYFGGYDHATRAVDIRASCHTSIDP